VTGVKKQNRPAGNRLINEKSPYLLQHANNPVDWHPWDDHALALAKKEGKPIFLSVGYSTCHWCHVMAHESFENPAIAALLNKHFINIKVDREERPDLDALYMNAVQMLTGAGGWPMSVWLTPDLKPFYAGTYFPPDDRYGRPAFSTVITQLAELWDQEKERVLESSVQITAALAQAAHTHPLSDLPSVDAAEDKAFAQLSAMHDPMHGGFGRAPKFPMPTYLQFLLDYYSRTKNNDALAMVSHTLTNMIRGGIYDQLGGGFARYSTDERWIVPHFEKMLYDNSQLTAVLARAVELSPNPLFEHALRETAAYILRQMTHPDGGFYSAEDADSEGKEGTFYLWTLAEVKKILGAGTDTFIRHVPVTVNGNFTDPHTGNAGQNILTVGAEADEKTMGAVQAMKQKLFHEQAKRPRPHLDDKIITEWNGLMISALARASAALNEEAWLDAAVKAARFIEKNVYDAASGVLYRRWRDGERKIEGHQADYAFFVQALWDLFETTGDPHWLKQALALHEKHNDLFWDSNSGGYFSAVQRDDLIVRLKNDTDNVTPSGNSIAVLNGFRLGAALDRPDLTQKAEDTLRSVAKNLTDYPVSLTSMLAGLSFAKRGASQIVIVGAGTARDTAALLKTARRRRSAGSVLLFVDPLVTQKKLATIVPAIQALVMVDGRATAYVCAHFSCQKPTTDPQELETQLETLTHG
jgi:uncharacterized protein YyaL (SSP411 family)